MFNTKDSSINGTCSTYAHMYVPKRGNVISYNSRIIQEYFQPKIGRKIRIFSLGRKNNILIKKKEVYL